jgi:hypothetical protein
MADNLRSMAHRPKQEESTLAVIVGGLVLVVGCVAGYLILFMVFGGPG